MSIIHRVQFVGDPAAIQIAASALGLSSDSDDGSFWLWGSPLTLSSNRKDWREQLDVFAKKANALIALSDPALSAIQPTGSVQIQDGDRRDHVIMIEPGKIELVGMPVTLSAHGGGPVPRPLAERVSELCDREPRFEIAANILAKCGDDLRDLYKVVELIAKSHGGFPKSGSPAQRQAFCRKIGVVESNWMALLRTIRPERHAEPHHDPGPTITKRQARHLVQHLLKVWLEREVPI